MASSVLSTLGPVTPTTPFSVFVVVVVVVIAQLSNNLGTVTSDPNGEATDEHTHFFVHKGHTHTVTHPHHPSHHHDWFERHHIFNPSDCKPGRMC